MTHLSSICRHFSTLSKSAMGRPRDGTPALYRLAARPMAVCIVLAIFAVSLESARADDAEHLKVRRAMTKLGPLVGQWKSAVAFYDQEGVTREVGIYSVSFVLDNTYLEAQMERHLEGRPERPSKTIDYVTFNPQTNRYESTYFYNGSALRVTETGEFDDQTQEYRTRAYIPSEDGVNDETVRTVTSFKDPNKIIYRHFSMRSPKETCQRMDLEIVLTRVPRS